jgi:hypothetical protein
MANKGLTIEDLRFAHFEIQCSLFIVDNKSQQTLAFVVWAHPAFALLLRDKKGPVYICRLRQAGLTLLLENGQILSSGTLPRAYSRDHLTSS